MDLSRRERRFYDRIRARVVRAEPGSHSGLRDLLLLLPDLTVLLIRLLISSHSDRSSGARLRFESGWYVRELL